MRSSPTRWVTPCTARPFLAVPRFAVKAALGGLSEDLLGSLRVSPAALTAAGFTFCEPDLRSALDVALA